MLILCLILWYISGMSSFVFWWTSEYDLTSNEVPLIFFNGFIGPISWILGYILHNKGTKILFKRRD